MASYSFKSAGKTQEQSVIEQITKTQFPFGIKTPVTIGDNGSIFAMNYKLENQLADNLKNLLLTNHGERLGFYYFGANLRPITTELSSQENFDNEAIARIKKAVDVWMPYIDLEDFSSSIDRNENKNTAIIKITISYNIPSIQVKNKRLQVVLYAI